MSNDANQTRKLAIRLDFNSHFEDLARFNKLDEYLLP